MIRLFALLPLVSASTALAHPGHLATEQGHDHRIAFYALAAAVGVAGVKLALMALRRRARVEAPTDARSDG